MPRTSSIAHPAHMRLVLIREDYLAIVDGDHCAAALLNIFEYWHNVKLDNAIQAIQDAAIAAVGNLPPEQHNGLWVYKSQAELKADMLDLFGETKIAAGVRLLIERGFLHTRRNPRYGWDRTTQYLFVPETVQAALSSVPSFLKNKEWKPQNYGFNASELPNGSPGNKAAIPETTPETPSVMTSRVVVENGDDHDRPNLYALVEQNVKGTLTPLLADTLTDDLQTYGAEQCEAALKEAVLSKGAHNVTWKYVQEILKRWAKEGRTAGGQRATERTYGEEYVERLDYDPQAHLEREEVDTSAARFRPQAIEGE